MNKNEGVHVRDTLDRLLCVCEGTVSYAGFQDRLFGAPGIWGLMRCPKSKLVWPNPQPIPNDVGKPLTSTCKGLKASVLRASFGYPMEVLNGLMRTMLIRISLHRDIDFAGGCVRWPERCASDNGFLSFVNLSIRLGG